MVASSPFSVLTAGKLLAVIVLVLANGFFVAAEFALVALRRSRVEQLVAEEHPRAKALQRAVNQLDAYLAATQLGVTMSSLGLGWLGEPALAVLIEPAFHWLPTSLAQTSAHTLSVLIAFIIITSLHIVLGELAPKSLALQRTERTAFAVIKPLELYLAVFRPAVLALNNIGNFVLKLIGLEPGSSEELLHSTEELKLLVAASHEAGLLGEAEQDVVERVFNLGDRRVSAFMTPRTEIVWLDINDPLETIRRQVISSIHSFFPVGQDSIDNLLGVVQTKEFLAQNPTQPLELQAILKPILYVPESMIALKLLELFKKSSNHIALIVDEYGVIQGLVTLTDIVEAIVGDIPSSEDIADPDVVQREDGSWLLDGLLPIDEFKEILQIRKLSPQAGVNYQTLGGFIVNQLGHIPAIAENFEWVGLRFEVVSMDGNRVDKVLVVPMHKKSEVSS
ncbi:hemolysin family protein [Nostoc sp. 106C]|uniref:hemolysin family protein n=1 Tax=Nostoc sp. 106C TaxID=1932667 RepID=UPI000A3C7456|nr:hemolysin family protein [Nostoc sp. 106C]OUL30751.1 hemolysin [Nostoc sp. RF31YmG]OUL35165.1 hemolysin [Nostoc sp. 106C]